MKHTKTVVVETVEEKEVVESVTCDICMQPCVGKLKGFSKNEDEDEDEIDIYEYEYLTIETNWGYFSDNKDGETWTAHVCEKCTAEHLSKLILFNKKCYMHKSTQIDAELNKVNDRKRKIRKTIGVEIDIRVSDSGEKEENKE